MAGDALLQVGGGAICCASPGARLGSIVTRVVADAETKTDRFASLRRIGIDEIS